MKKQEIEKNRNELFEAIPKLRNVYRKAFNYIFIIKFIICTLLPAVSITISYCIFQKTFNNDAGILIFLNTLNIINIILLFLSLSQLINFILDFFLFRSENNTLRKGLRISAIRDWEKYYDNILLPLYEMKQKKLTIESLAEVGILFTNGVNFKKISFIDYLAIGMEVKQKHNWLLIFIPIWQFLGGEKLKKQREYFREEFNIKVNNFFEISSIEGRSLGVGHKVCFLSKPTEQKLLKFIKNHTKKDR